MFQNTGVGIKNTDDSASKIVGKRLIGNENGIVAQGNARSILRGNYIESNIRDGVAAIAQSLPDLGHSQEPGRNTIRNNGRYDIYAVVKGKTIPAYGNSLAGDRNYGSIDTAGKIAIPPQVAPLTTTSTLNQVEKESQPEDEIIETTSTEPESLTTQKNQTYHPQPKKPRSRVYLAILVPSQI